MSLVDHDAELLRIRRALERIDALQEYTFLMDGNRSSLNEAERQERLQELRKRLWPGKSALRAAHSGNPMNHAGRMRGT